MRTAVARLAATGSDVGQGEAALPLGKKRSRGSLQWLDVLCWLSDQEVYDEEVPIGEASTAETGKMDSYFLLNGIITHPIIQDNAYLFVGCENILGEDYEEDYGYPMPDRMFYGGIEVRL